jgi:hypothetical protein
MMIWREPKLRVMGLPPLSQISRNYNTITK